MERDSWNNILYVNPDDLKYVASEVKTIVNGMAAKIDELEDYMSATNLHWHGDAADMYRKMFYEQEELLIETLNQIREIPKILTDAAGIYEEAERVNESKSEALPIDAIQ